MATTKQPNLLTLSQLREIRGAMSGEDLLRRCRDAARLEMRGAMFSTDDRLDCAAHIMADGLTETGGALPNATDARHSLGSYCKRAQTVRRSVLRERERKTLAAQLEADRAAWTVDALTPDYVHEPLISTPQTAAAMADRLCHRLAQAPHSVCDGKAYANVWRLLYGYARDLPGAVVAHEIDLSPNAYDVACNRARSSIRKRYPQAIDWMRALIGEPIPTVDHMSGEPVWRYVLTDASREAHSRTHLLAADWREGTDGGSWPTRPTDADAARAVCTVTRKRAAPVTASKARKQADKQAGGHDQATADALRRLGYAIGR